MTEPVKPPSPDWVSQRPFWGGLLLFLSGFELFLSSNLNLGALQVHFGPSGFLSYLLPAMLLLCGVLAVLSPGQRLFYGIVGLLTALFSLIGLNLGGFFLGVILGVLGGALTVAWAPIAPKAPEENLAESPEEHPDDDFYALPTAEHDRTVPQSFEAPSAYADDHAYGAHGTVYSSTALTGAIDVSGSTDLGGSTGVSGSTDLGGDETVVTPAAKWERPREGLLTDSLPTANRSPLHAAAEEEPPPSGAGSADDSAPDVDGPLPRRRSAYRGGFLILVILGAVVYATGTRPSSAYAAPPCATPTVKATVRPTGTPGSAPTTAPAAPPTATPTPSPSPSDGNVLKDILNGILGLVTGGNKKAEAPTPSAAPAEAPTTAPAPVSTTTPKATKRPPTPTCTPSATASPSPTAPKKATLAAGQPYVNDPPSTMLAQLLTMSGLSYDGVVNLPTKTGSIAVLKFSMDKSVSTPFELDTPADKKTLFTKSSSLTVAGHVSFYTSSFSGNVLGVIPMTFTPDQPPPLILPELFFTNCTIKLVFVQSDLLTAPGLAQNY